MKIQASILGFTGKPCTVLATMADEGGAIYIAKSVDYKAERVSDCVVVANTELSVVDFLFGESDLGEAIDAYLILKSGGQISFASGSVQSSDPQASIEPDGVSETGRRMRIADDIKNAQIAVLAIALYSSRARDIGKAESMMDGMLNLLSRQIFSI